MLADDFSKMQGFVEESCGIPMYSITFQTKLDN
jgi:hypothetical protein